MSTEKNSGIARYLTQLVDRIGSTRFSGEDRAIVRQHMLDAIAVAFIGCRSKVFQDLTQSCPRVSRGCGWPASGSERINPLDACMVWAFAINASVFEDGFREGACHPAKVSHPLGEPENPLPSLMTKEKFRGTAGLFLSKKSMDRIEAILNVSGLTDSAQTLFETLSENNSAQ